MRRPSFHDLTLEQQARFGNGVGPYWLPDWARAGITSTACWFFKDASWRHHDFGYVVGGDRWDRARCDWKFLIAMLRDAITQPRLTWPVAAPVAVLISLFFYVNVRLFGQLGSFRNRDRYLSIDEIMTRFLEGSGE